MAKLCMGCMNPLPDGVEYCAVCGHGREQKNPEGCLAIASALQGHYIVGKVAGQSGDSILYLGYDRTLKDPCFIQEFFPSTLCQRQADGTVQPLGGCENPFEECAGQFRTLMRGLARMRELASILPVYDIFEENGTVYAVCDYCEGMTLTKKLKLSGGRLPWAEARPLFMSLMSCVTHLHDAGIRHLAICPDNILIDQSGKPRLRGFAVAESRHVGSDLTPQLSTGYAAPEQYSADAELTDATDVYGMAATLFRTVTGNEPPAGNNRAKNSDDLFMSSEVADELSQSVCVALFNALQVNPEKRISTMAQLRNLVSTEQSVADLVDEVKEEDRQPAPPRSHPVRNFIIIFICCLVALLAAVLVAFAMLGGDLHLKPEPEPESSAVETVPTLTTTTTTQNKEKQSSVDDIVGRNYYDLRDTKLGGDMTVQLDYLAYSDKEAGTILSQEPAAGTIANKHSVVKVVISLGQKSETVKVPDVSGWPEEHARLYLEALGFRVDTVKLQASKYDKGLVDSTDPAVGTKRLMGDTITLRVSNVKKAATDEPVVSDVPAEDANADNETE